MLFSLVLLGFVLFLVLGIEPRAPYMLIPLSYIPIHCEDFDLPEVIELPKTEKSMFEERKEPDFECIYYISF